MAFLLLTRVHEKLWPLGSAYRTKALPDSGVLTRLPLYLPLDVPRGRDGSVGQRIGGGTVAVAQDNHIGGLFLR